MMGLHSLDWAVLGVYFAAILGIGLWFGRGERSTHDYFLGARRQHWFVVGLSIIATEVSALTFIVVPGEAFRGDWTYLQMYAGAFIGRVLIVFLLLPAFYGSAVTTVYEYLGRRFGPCTRATTSVMFFASRIVGSGFRLLAASLAITIVFGWPLTWVVIGVVAVAIAYTTFGGIKAIIWTDAFQAIIFVVGGLTAVGILFLVTPGSWMENLGSAYEAGKLHTFTWDWHPNNDKAFWVLLIHATVFSMAAMGTDQDLTQRMLTCPDLRRSQRSLMFNAFAGLPIVCLFLLIGALLFVYYQAQGNDALPAEIRTIKDRVFPYFIAHALPSGFKGLLVAGIFAACMSSLDSALGALSSTAVTDFYRPYIRTKGDDRHYLLVARMFTFLFGILLAVVALAFAESHDLLWEVFRWVSLIFGGMLGVFVLGVTTKKRGNDKVNVIAMLSSVALLAALKLWQEHYEVEYIAWPWWIVLGTAWTFAFGACWRTERISGPSGAQKKKPTQGVEP